MITLEVLLLVVVLALAVFVCRGLIHSKSFARLLGGVLDVPPESDDEVIGELDEAQRRAQQRAEEASREASEKKATATKLRRRAKLS
jgi:hypothetical protein